MRAENFARAADLDDATRVHDDDARRASGDHTQVVGDEYHRHSEVLFELIEQIENLCLNGDVEARGGFVGEKQLR